MPLSASRLARAGADIAAWLLGILGRMERAAARGTTILMYHRVLPDDQWRDYPLPQLAVPLSLFERQAAWLASRCDVMPVCEAVVERRGRPVTNRPRVCITFDDGYRDNAEQAAPVLEARGVRATFFVSVEFVGRGGWMWFDRAALHWAQAGPEAVRNAIDREADLLPGRARAIAGMKAWLNFLMALAPAARDRLLDKLDALHPLDAHRRRCEPMTVEHLRDLDRRGHEIGSHTLTHPLLYQLRDEALQDELAGSRAALEAWLAKPVLGFCYPNGQCDARILRRVQDAGYAYACTTRPGWNPEEAAPLTLARRNMAPGYAATAGPRLARLALRAEVVGWHDRLRSLAGRVARRRRPPPHAANDPVSAPESEAPEPVSRRA